LHYELLTGDTFKPSEKIHDTAGSFGGQYERLLQLFELHGKTTARSRGQGHALEDEQQHASTSTAHVAYQVGILLWDRVELDLQIAEQRWWQFLDQAAEKLLGYQETQNSVTVEEHRVSEAITSSTPPSLNTYVGSSAELRSSYSRTPNASSTFAFPGPLHPPSVHLESKHIGIRR
jgi:hypothetical protein